MATKVQPSLFGIKNSNRDFSKKDGWSKNTFNSTFPASLIAYMGSKGTPCRYLKLNSKGSLDKEFITAKDLFKENPLSDDLFYSFESAYTPFQTYSVGNPPKVDLMLLNKKKDEILAGYEIKLTTIPDQSTFDLSEEKYSCEIVIRMPSIHFLACNIASIYKDKPKKLSKYFGKNGFGNVASYVEAAQVNPKLGEIWKRLNDLIQDNLDNQKPAIIQPIWKTKGKSIALSDDCLDVFVWSDLAFTQLFMKESAKVPEDITIAVTRPTRALIQLFFMLNEFYVHGKFNPTDIFNKLSYTFKNDKAFSVPGARTLPLMTCPELNHPRVSKFEIKNIILGGGQNLLSPERRFDAALVSAPEIFKNKKQR